MNTEGSKIMPTFQVLDRKRAVLWTGDDHIDARTAFKRINAETPGRSHFIVDDTGRTYGTLKQNSEAASPTALINSLKLRVPPAVWALVRAAAGGDLQKSRDVARSAIDDDAPPAAPVAIEPGHPAVVVRVANVMRDQLERRARARNTTVEQVCVAALIGWAEGLEAKAVA